METLVAVWRSISVFVAARPKRFEAVGLALIAATAIFELTIATNNTYILDAKVQGVYERLAVFTEFVVDCQHAKEDCKMPAKIPSASEAYSDQVLPTFYQSLAAKFGKYTWAFLGTLFIFLEKWFDGYKPPDEKPAEAA
jgi:hypothetical protein